MRALPGTATGRIFLAIALSLLVHALLLFGLHIRLFPAVISLPPLTVRLESLDSIAPLVGLPEPADPTQKPEVKEPFAIEKTQSGAVEKKSIRHLSQQKETARSVFSADQETIQNKFEPQMLKPVQLSFIIHGDTANQTGEARYELEINDQHYVLTAIFEMAGGSGMIQTHQIIQISRGVIGEHGFKPEQFSEEVTDINGVQSFSASFDWEKNKLTLADGSAVDLLAQTQDALSFLYQFSQLPLDREIVPQPVTDGKILENDGFGVSQRETINTGLGKLDTVKLRKMHTNGQSWVEIWLGLEYQLLPVKIRQLDGDGKTTSEMVISSVRSGDQR